MQSLRWFQGSLFLPSGWPVYSTAFPIFNKDMKTVAAAAVVDLRKSIKIRLLTVFPVSGFL
jgi:hypothetical protein